MSDLIDRQVAIDVLSLGKEILSRVLDDTDVVGTDKEKYSWGLRLIESSIEDIKELPPAQPEIIRCKDCKWYELPSHKIYENCVRWMKSNCILLPIKPDDYCGYAERRTDSDGRD